MGKPGGDDQVEARLVLEDKLAAAALLVHKPRPKFFPPRRAEDLEENDLGMAEVVGGTGAAQRDHVAQAAVLGPGYGKVTCMVFSGFLSFFLGFTDSLVQLQERSRLLAVGYGRKSAASGRWDVLGSRVRGQDPSRGGVHEVWVGES